MPRLHWNCEGVRNLFSADGSWLNAMTVDRKKFQTPTLLFSLTHTFNNTPQSTGQSQCHLITLFLAATTPSIPRDEVHESSALRGLGEVLRDPVGP